MLALWRFVENAVANPTVGEISSLANGEFLVGLYVLSPRLLIRAVLSQMEYTFTYETFLFLLHVVQLSRFSGARCRSFVDKWRKLLGPFLFLALQSGQRIVLFLLRVSVGFLFST